MPKRALRIVTGSVVVAVAVVAALLGATRLLRHHAGAPGAVGPHVVHVRNLFTDLYGARVGGKVILFDAGVDEAGDALDRLLGALGATRDDVSDVFLTHGHFDHVAASPLCRKARIHVGAPDVALLAHEVTTEPAAARWLSKLFSVPPIRATDPFVGTMDIALPDGRSVRALPLPGHTLGSYVLLFDGVLFAGDSLQIDGDHLTFAMPDFSMDMAQNRAGLARLGAALDGARVDFVCTGHQVCTPPGRARAMLDDLVARAAR